ncbi:MAG: phospholipid carrier-dependent glycosyltransferase [Defluviitaleaceae bacterium]|nr:phospholipid carrier-dependent glycosyltransferase [Defluviitaleaceae bacterium]
MQKYYIWFIMAAALLVRLLAAFVFNDMSHPTDIQTFGAWANMLTTNGFAAFYGTDAFTDYPPGYMYILGALGTLREVFDLPWGSADHHALLKTPAMLFDIATVALIYKIAMKFNENRNFAAIVALIYALNPAIILNSAVWGQVESIHTFLLVLSIYFIGQRKMLPSVLLFAISIVVKPQSFIFSPIYLFMFFKYIFGEGTPQFDAKRLGCLALYGLGCFALIGLLFIPFIDFTALPDAFLEIPIFAQYVNTFTTYPFITHNAYNLYAMLGLNTAPLTAPFEVLGFAFLAALTLFAFFLLWKKNDVGSLFLVGALLVIGTFLLSFRMHERYNFPAMVMLLLAYVVMRDRRLLYVYLGYSAVHFLNNIDVLLMSVNDFNRVQIEHSAVIFAIPLVLLSIYAIYMAVTIFTRRPKISLPVLPVKYKDVIICGAITLFYAIFAFTNLGDVQSPQSNFTGQAREEIVVDFGATYNVSRIQFMAGGRHHQPFVLEFSQDGEIWADTTHLITGEVFTWSYHDTVGIIFAQYVRITPLTSSLVIREMGFREGSLFLIPTTVISATGHELFDEQHLVPYQPTDYMHSAYFDEIYHPRTAYEFIHGMDVFEWSHPPLGKIIIALGIQFFGATPFGWRFAGAFFGVLMLPLIYAFALRLFAKSKGASFWAAFATFIFAFDFMHYAQTRLATIDTYVVIFIMAMYYFMYRYTQTNFLREPLWKTMMPLLFSGIFMGLAIASKWQGAYGAIGIAVIFFWTLLQRRKEAKNAECLSDFWRKAGITCAACFGFFIAIPLAIYIASYIPFWNTGYMHINRMAYDPAYIHHEMGFLAAWWQNQVNMFDYHSGLDAFHFFSSTWWQWIINARPMWYFYNELGPYTVQTISSFGNPLVWWGGIPALAYCIYAWAARKDKTAAFLVIAYLSQILPWIFVPRLAFIYHYFPNVPFIALMLAHTLKGAQIFCHNRIGQFFNRKAAAIAFAIACFALFILFYPVITGIPINRDFVTTYLQWLPSWTLLV